MLVSILVFCDCGQHFETSDADVGMGVRCPNCRREIVLPKTPLLLDDELLPWGSERPVFSRNAIASLILGVFFFFACLTGIPAIVLGWQALNEIRSSGGQIKGRRMAVAGILLGLIGCLFSISLLMPLFRSSREAARRAQCTNNLKEIGLAIHNYHDAYGCLPPAALTGKNGKPLLSWRVAILPFADASPLYARFHLDEPWDSPNNLALLDQMPLYYACPSDRTRKVGTTGYQAVIGSATAFTPDFKPVSFRDITDGIGVTIVVAESRHCVPWTKPEDRPFDMAIPFTGLGSYHGYHNNGFNAVFADGSVGFLRNSIEPKLLASYLTRNGNEVFYSHGY
jgi:prepilin-type processing-associated H-X9-DG protein